MVNANSAAAPGRLRCGRFSLDLGRPLLMGIVNVTPDSFHDGGAFLEPARAVEHARRLIAEGADIIDVGGESTRPGAEPVSEAEELARILPVLRELRDAAVPVAVDTMKPGVMRAALAEGASMINDVNALRAAGALEAAGESQAGVCLMHMLGEPRTMQADPHYDDVVGEVRDFLGRRAAAAEAAGIARERIVVDPGFGFGKTVAHNMLLLRELGSLRALGLPVLFGASRKSSLARITGREGGDRLHASVAAALLAAERGASILRVHDVSATRDALAVWQAMKDARPRPDRVD
jgi:dihydropteroate synthase